jgi:hypothetical protein
MNITLRNPIVLVWLMLVVMTLITWVIGLEHGFAGENGLVIGMVAILAVAFLKVHLVGRYFMELATAPFGLKFAFGSWVVGVGAIVIGLYAWG